MIAQQAGVSEDVRKLREFLCLPGIPYERTLLEQHSSRILSILRGGNPPPHELEIQPSAVCNAHCSHCWAREVSALEDRLDSEEAIDRVINQVLNFEQDGFKVEIVKFCGSTGEPLVNPNTVYAINQLYGKRFLRLFTNGIKLGENKDNLDYLGIIAKIDRINVSLDAGSTFTLHQIKPGSRHVDLEDILEAVRIIKSLRGGQTSVEASYVITNENYQEIEQAVRKIKKSGAGKVRFRINLIDRTVSEKHGDEINRALEISKAYENSNFQVIPVHSGEEVKKTNGKYFSSKCSEYDCFTSRFWACVGSNGGLYPYGHIVSGDAESYGNILEDNLADIWNSHRRESVTHDLPGEKCTICSPFSLRINRFATEFLYGLSPEHRTGLLSLYSKK